VRSAFFLPTTVDSIFQHRLFWHPADAEGAAMTQTTPTKKRVNVYVRDRKCPKCLAYYQSHEEKKTDINIAITLLGDAVLDKFDTALIFSGDSDLAPVSTKLRQLCHGKKIGIIIPKGQLAVHLKQHADFFKTIQAKDFKKSLLPEQVTYNGKVITAPAGWLPA